MKRFFIVTLALAIGLCLFSACGGDELVGTWDYISGGVLIVSYTFNEDGTGSISSGTMNESFEWTVKGEKLTVTVDDSEDSSEYHIDGDTLVIGTGAAALTLTKR